MMDGQNSLILFKHKYMLLTPGEQFEAVITILSTQD